ncbi:hypothetical protein HETIRDRAFT_319620 [Heterobasidion irregulare TC 32-1]|uniref:Uncharacterized protein n=1 Tax=Heterobasidion irregulare (strain TC 32-1) TaxID=747525 RepID=W4K5W2_HETIT|nr:uncharacterized protein HETIRDRAFT_319620 [Heterobasidion irregulare TC 32-1]ETW81203.1 hypothetical protein HETIRDRAFT_319620 [Heterobasidion irregulare TC 32-1]
MLGGQRHSDGHDDPVCSYMFPSRHCWYYETNVMTNDVDERQTHMIRLQRSTLFLRHRSAAICSMFDASIGESSSQSHFASVF